MSDQLTNEKLQEETQKVRKQELDDLAEVMGSDAGKRLIWRLLEQTRVFNQTFVPDNPHSTSFNEGRRSFGNQILADIHDDKRCRKSYFEILATKQGD